MKLPEYLEFVVSPAKHSQSELPLAAAAAAGPVVIGNDDAGGCGHVRRVAVLAGKRHGATSVDDEDCMVCSYEHCTVARGATIRTALERRLDLPCHGRSLVSRFGS